jgi:integrase-like protein
MNADETKRCRPSPVASRRILLSLGYGCGLRAGEVVRLKVKHIDSAQKIIRVEQLKGRKDRDVMLSGPRRSISCANGGRRVHRVTMREYFCRNVGCFPATDVLATTRSDRRRLIERSGFSVRCR